MDKDGLTMEERIIAMLGDICGADPGEIQPDTALFDEGILDSFGLVQLIVALEEAFGVALDPAELERVLYLDPDILEAAKGMGSTQLQSLLRVKLPMAAGVILAGVRNMVVMTISVAAIASFIGAGGLGVAIYRGITIYDTAMAFSGSLLIALLAILCDGLLGIVEKRIKKGMHLI